MNGRRRVEELSKLQHGVVTSEDLRVRCELTAGEVRAMLAAGELERVFKSVYVCTWAPLTWEQRAMRVLQWLGPAAALSHRSAASLHAFDGFEQRPGKIEVQVAHEDVRHDRLELVPKGFVVHRTRLPFGIVVVDGLRVVEVQRTLVDLAGCTTLEQLDDALDSALREKKDGEPVLDEALIRALAKRQGRDGAGAVLRLINERHGERTDSRLENRVFRRLRARGLVPRHQHELFDAKGYVTRADFAWLDERVALHVDSWGYHRQRHQFERDREVATRLAAMGWLSVWVTSRMLANDDWLDALERALRERGPQRSLFIIMPQRPGPPTGRGTTR